MSSQETTCLESVAHRPGLPIPALTHQPAELSL